MPHLRSFMVGDVLYRDVRAPMRDELRHYGAVATAKRMDVVLDEGKALAGEEPGCGYVRESAEAGEFTKYRTGGGRKDLSEWREHARTTRASVEPETKEAFTLYGWRNDEPIGGLLVANVSINRVAEGVAHFTAGCGPFLDRPKTAHDLMIYMLENELLDGQGRPFQLDRWVWHVEARRNRFDTRLSSFEGLPQRASHMKLDMEVRDGQTFIAGMRRS